MCVSILVSKSLWNAEILDKVIQEKYQHCSGMFLQGIANLGECSEKHN